MQDITCLITCCRYNKNLKWKWSKEHHVFQISVEFLFFIVPVFSYLLEAVGAALEIIGYEEGPYDTVDTNTARILLYILYYTIESAQSMFYSYCKKYW